MAALKAIAALPEIIKEIKDGLIKLGDSITEKNIATLKSEFSNSLIKIKNAKSKDERATAIEEASKKASK